MVVINMQIKRKSCRVLCFLIIVMARTVYAQQADTLTLDQAIVLAHENSLRAKIAVNTMRSGYWDYKNYRFSLLPRLSLSGVIPNYYHSINRITLQSGENSFVSQNIANSNIGLDLSQNIALTGGTVSMRSSLARLDNFSSVDQTSYSSEPYLFSYYQNTIFYNQYKWQKRIQPLKYEEAQRDYREQLEEIAYTTVALYFSVLTAQTQVMLDEQNQQYADTLLRIMQTRTALGTVNKDVLLQSRVALFTAKKALANSELALEVARQNLVRHLNLGRHDRVVLRIPDQVMVFTIDPDEALVHALNNRKSVIEFMRRRLEAEHAIAKTKAETGPSVSLRTNFGLSQTGRTLQSVYADPLNSQSLEIGFYIPVLDWGVNRSNRKRAEANETLERSYIEQEERVIEQEVFVHAMKWNMVTEQMDIARETRTMADEYYTIMRRRYTLGTVTLMDFNNAQFEKDKAVTDYLTNLREYWTLYFLLRKLTLFDFITKTPLPMADLDFK